jgi:conjugative transfer region protein (TIGR03750 family)
MDRQDSLLADQLNSEPTIFQGCTFSELGVLTVVTILLWLPLSFTLAGWLGTIGLGMGFAADGY